MANLPLTEFAVPDYPDDIFVIGGQERADITTLQNAVAALEETTEGIPAGTFPELTAGSVLSKDAYTKDTLPYLYRAMPYVSKRLEDAIVGGSVVWNQLVYNNQTATLSMPNSRTLNISTNSQPSIVNHIYYFSCNVTADTTVDGLSIQYAGTINFGQGTGTKTKIGKCTTAITYIYAYIGSGESSGASLTYKDFNAIDLTAMFGSTIADYVYTLESGTAGAGIAWLKSYGFFTKPYYEYDTGTLKSVNPTAHVTRGVNAWDEEWEQGGINANTGENTSSRTIRSKNYIPVVPSMNYYCNTSILGIWYDANKNYIGYSSNGSALNTIEAPSNARYFRFRTDASYGTTYNNDICINISDPTINGKYFPYEEHTYPLSDVTLRGIPKLVNNELVYDGDIYEYDGSVTKKYASVTVTSDMVDGVGTASTGVKYATVTIALAGKDNLNGMSVGYEKVSFASSTDKKFRTVSNVLYVYDNTFTDMATAKSTLNGKTFVYELATPTTETTTPFEQYQICETGGTEEYITTNDVPVGHDTKYFTDVIGNIEDIPAPPTADGTYTLKVTVSSGVPTYAWV